MRKIGVGLTGGKGRIAKLAAHDIVSSDVLELRALAVRGKDGMSPAERVFDEYSRSDRVYRITFDVEIEHDHLVRINGSPVHLFPDVDTADWGEARVDIVGEATGQYKTRELASTHLRNGAKNVIIACPPKDDSIESLVMGVNHGNYDRQKHDIFSNSSCTTKSVVSPTQALKDYGIEIYGMSLATVHAATGSQGVMDSLNNIITRGTGAGKGVGQVIDSLRGYSDGFCLRIPIDVGSITVVNMMVGNVESAEQINSLLEKASRDPQYAGRIDFIADRDVYSNRDIVGNGAASIVIGKRTGFVGPFDGKGLLTLALGYDNECGSARDLKLMMEHVAREGLYRPKQVDGFRARP